MIRPVADRFFMPPLTQFRSVFLRLLFQEFHPNLEDSMVAASVAPPTPEQRKHSAYHFGAISKVLVKNDDN